MKFIAIASINRGESVVGARILGIEDLKVRDCTNEQLERIINEGNTVRNITLESGKVTWSQGVASRYPMLDADRLSIISNANSITVLGSYKNNNKIPEYIVVNYNGKLAPLNEHRLIEYGKQYSLSNCKVYTKANKSHIASLSGDIDKLIGEAEFQYNVDTRVVTVTLPAIWSTKLVIPNSIKGNTLRIPQTIEIVPEILASKITHLVLGKGVKEIRANLFKNLPKLRILECEGNIEEIYSNTFCYCKGLTDIYLGNVNDMTHEVFENLRYLKNVKFGIKPTVIGECTFKNCERVNISDMLYEGLFSVEKEALRGCTQLIDVVIPKSLKRLGSSAFRYCPNIESLRITNSSMRIEPDRFGAKGDREAKRRNTGELVRLLEDSPNAVLYCPYSFPESIITECVARHVKVIRDTPTVEELALVNTQAKASIIGVKIASSDVAKTAREVLGFLTLIEEVDWRAKLLDCIKNAIKAHSYGGHLYTIGYKGAHLQISLGYSGFIRGWDKDIRQAKVGKHYMYVAGANSLLAYLVDKEMIKDRVETNIKNGTEHLLRSISSLGGVIPGSAFTLDIPTYHENIKYDKISKIYEENNNLILEYKNKEMAAEIIIQG